MSIRAIIFDLGHTLWDIGPHDEALARAYRDAHALICDRFGRADLPAPERLQAAVRDVLMESAETYFSNGPELSQPPTHTFLAEGCRRLGLDLDEDVLRELTPPLFCTESEALIVTEGTRDAIVALRNDGYALGCITNTLADGASIRRMLRSHGFEELLASVVVSADERLRKPHAALFEKAITELGAEPGEAVFVGDSPYHDIGGAKAVGMWAVLTHQYVARPHDGFDPKPDAIIRHVSELRTIVPRLG